MCLLEFLDRTGKHISAKIFNKYRDEKHAYSEWESLTSFSTNKGE